MIRSNDDDTQFRLSFKEAKPDTQEFINDVMVNVDSIKKQIISKAGKSKKEE